jgi:hypothetical protein
MAKEVPDSRSARQLFEWRSGMKAMRGGSSDAELKEPTVIPTGLPWGDMAVTTTTPVG